MSGLPLSVKLQIPASHPMFAGHFPHFPVVPGGWLLAQAITALEQQLGPSFGWGRVDSAKFHSPVSPGACLDVILARRGSSALELSICEGGEPAASIRFGPV